MICALITTDTLKNHAESLEIYDEFKACHVSWRLRLFKSKFPHLARFRLLSTWTLYKCTAQSATWCDALV